ncbi:MAG TPA: hypothetical protein PKY35_04905 [Candidatus Hydrogenedentes bacterium]|nr:hypothetical protein [Candidatus Hydrogenedentota bacterium]HOL76349.1 hypothetical protein [Candidatus Hydrogenedentota bacterium]HPO85387.1 hypothetical protein [Candidatus Hydrogenedentota bacterium]
MVNKSHIARIVFSSIFLFGLVTWAAPSQVPSLSMPVTEGVIYALAETSDTLYVGGYFSYIGPWTGGGVPVSTSNLTPLSGFARVNGIVNACVADGSGGWFIGGQFQEVGGVPRSNLAHILSDGTLDTTWNASTDNSVLTLALHAGTLFVGGYFSNVNSTPRSRIAAIDASTGNVLATWTANTNGYCQTMLVVPSNGILVVGGGFTQVGTQTRQGIAALDLANGAPTAWAPNPDGDVYALAYQGNNLYIGGSFSQFAGQPRTALAAVSLADGSLLPGAPNPNGVVYSILAETDRVYVGGSFSAILGTTRYQAAALNLALTSLESWNPNTNASGNVEAIARVGTSIYLGGWFDELGGVPRRRLASVDPTTGAPTLWHPLVNFGVACIVPSGSSFYVGGSFTSYGGYERANLAAVDTLTGQVKADWAPMTDTTVRALAVSGDKVFVGGDFWTIFNTAKITRSRLAAVDATTGAVNTSWLANPDLPVHALTVGPDALYVGGEFSGIGGASRNHIAALNLETGDALDWNPGANDTVYALTRSGDTVFAGGSFTQLGGSTRNYVGAIAMQDGSVRSTTYPAITGPVKALAYKTGTLMVGGQFADVPNHVQAFAVLNANTGNLICATDNVSSPVVTAVLPYGDTVFLGGEFDMVNGETHYRLAAVSPSTAALLSWAPDGSGISEICAFTARRGKVTVGGYFPRLGETYVSHLARFEGFSPQEGNITVNVTPDTAQWTLAGPEGFEGTGAVFTGDKTFNTIPSGEYVWTGKPIAGWVTPSTQTITLNVGDSQTLTKTWYQPGTVVVNVTPDTASWTLAGPAGFEGNGTTYTGDHTFTNAPVGNYTWTGNALAGYNTPATQTQTLTNAGTITFTKTWTATGGGGGTPGGCTKQLAMGVEGSQTYATLPAPADAVLLLGSGGVLALAGRIGNRRRKK